MSPRLQTNDARRRRGTSIHAVAARAPAGRRRRPGRAASAARSRCARRRPTASRVAPSSADSGRSGTARSGRRSGVARTSPRSRPRPIAMPRISASATRSISSSHAQTAGPSPAGCGGEQVGAVQRRAGAHPRMVGRVLGAEVDALLAIGSAGGQLAADRKPAPPSPPGVRPSRSRPSRRRRARRTRATASRVRSCSTGSTPWPTMPKNPISRHASSIWSPRQRRRERAAHRIEQGRDVDDRQVASWRVARHNW